jgi:hypothetical protein
MQRTKELIKLAVGSAAILIVVALVIWRHDPPWRVTEVQGSVVNSHQPQAPNLVIRYYRMDLLVKTDDGRTVQVSSERRAHPTVGERIKIQERVGLLGTRAYVEIPTGN